MTTDSESIERLLSLPPRMAAEFRSLDPDRSADWFAASDPRGCNLGSGGGTAHLLAAAWRATEQKASFVHWLRRSRKMIVHAGGESRRLPAYAATGKALIPIPALRWSHGQRLDQTLLDLQRLSYERILRSAPVASRVMVTSGDVLLRFSPPLAGLPEVDVLTLGLWVKPDLASRHGVFFCPRSDPSRLAFFLQKPSPARILELGADHLFLVDVGVWLLSERAVHTLMGKCGWSESMQDFESGRARNYELYAEFGLGLGSHPARQDPEVNSLSSAVVPLPQGEFYHFGTSRTLIESVAALHNAVVDQTRWGMAIASLHPDMHLQSCEFHASREPGLAPLWVENSCVPSAWRPVRGHVLTGIPANEWDLRLDPGVCLDFSPIGMDGLCLRFYGIDDPFRGAAGDPDAIWLGRPPREWFAARGLAMEDCGLEPGMDLQLAPLFPVLPRRDWDPRFIEWLIAPKPSPNAEAWGLWRRAPRLSAQQIMEEVNLPALLRQRNDNLRRILPQLARSHRRSVFYRLDLDSTAGLYAAGVLPLPPELPQDEPLEPMRQVQDSMFRAAVRRRQGDSCWEESESRAFSLLRDLIVHETELEPAAPRRCVLEDQIVWGRSPLRLDLAGGWTDTPPYCLQFGGKVVNVAVDLNGQPPIQVFARTSDRPELVIRSIDLGLEERVHTFEELATFDRVGSGFTIAKAALALAGFLPRFGVPAMAPSLEERLHEFGGGIEVSLLSAVPKGSGLGTSSILAATLLATLSDLCDLQWSHHDLFRRTLALEQLLTTGGGWQDQIGGVLHGLKLIETEPGLVQTPTVRWLPDRFFTDGCANRTVLLYYTGLTRVAKDILKEIVRRMFLNARTTLEILEEIGLHAHDTADALQRHDWHAFGAALAGSWTLNQRLDSGTNPPAVQAILNSLADYLEGAKLLGAGGGGFMLMAAKDDEAGRRIRATLGEHPPNVKARFVDLRLSGSGLEVTRS